MDKKLKVKMPLLWNFFSVGDTTLPIQDFTDKEIRQITKEFTAALIQSAQEKRKTATKNKWQTEKLSSRYPKGNQATQQKGK